MSKITNDGLTRSGTGWFVAVYRYGNSWRQRVNHRISLTICGLSTGCVNHVTRKQTDHSRQPPRRAIYHVFVELRCVDDDIPTCILLLSYRHFYAVRPRSIFDKALFSVIHDKLEEQIIYLLTLRHYDLIYVFDLILQELLLQANCGPYLLRARYILTYLKYLTRCILLQF